MTAPSVAWPPDLALLKLDMSQQGEAGAPDRDDEQLQLVLDAAVAFVQSRRPAFNYDADPLDERPAPDATLRLGTVRLAWRWHTRRRSPDALIQSVELGSSRVPAFDADIERMLKLGRYHGPVVA